ncbi:MAG TPA: GntR family transcriptional regulator [bacterium]|nr:GntR family transcriptional regulator [bacterium]
MAQRPDVPKQSGKAKPAGVAGRRRDPMAGRPLYRQLFGSINTRIQKGDWAADGQLPSERDLSEQFGVSRSTVRQALEQLSRAGLLKKVQGRGTFIAAHHPITQPLERVTAFREALAAQGLEPGLSIVSRTQVPCDVVLSRVLGVPPETALLYLVSLGLGDGDPLAIYRSYFAAHKVAALVGPFERMAASGTPPRMLSELYAERAGLHELRAEQTFEVRLATAEDAGLLGLERPAAVFSVASLISTLGGEAVEYRLAVYRGDRYKFNIERLAHIMA